MSIARCLGVYLALGAFSIAAPAAAQRELLRVFPLPSDANARLIVTASAPGSSMRSSVVEWVVPSNRSGESPNVSVGILGRARATPTRFTLVTETAACIVTSRQSAVVFAGLTATGETLSARIVPIAGCAAPIGALALSGSHRAARLMPLLEDTTARARLPATLPPDQSFQTPLTARGLPFIVLGGYERSIGAAYVYCGTTLLAQRAAYARSLLIIGPRVFLVADRALWRSELVSLDCP